MNPERDIESSEDAWPRTIRYGCHLRDLPPCFAVMIPNPHAPLDVARAVVSEPAARWPNKPAMVFLTEHGEREFTFGQVARQVAALATRFSEQGVRRADRVALRLPHSPEFVATFFAVIAAGAVPVATSPALTEAEFQWIVEDSRARWIARPSLVDIPLDTVEWSSVELCAVERTDEKPFEQDRGPSSEDEPAWMVYTSGTSGHPRGVVHAHRALRAREWMRDGWTGLQAGDRLMHAGQLNWSYTIGCAIMDTWRIGATGVLLGYQPAVDEWPALIRRGRATIFAAVPSLYRRILKYAPAALADLPLRHALTAGEALSPDLAQRWQQATNRPLFEALGMTECSTYLSSGPATPVRAGSAGKPQPGRRVVLLPIDVGTDPVGPGELGVIAIHRSDPGLMLGYHNRPEEEAAMMRGEWFVTGDLAVTDDDGYFYTRGRNDDVMNASGYRVSPAEVEDVLRLHPQVSEVGVTDVEVGDGVKIVCAFVVPIEPETEGTTALATELLEHAARALAPWKCPRRVVFTHALPRNANGKLLRRQLRSHVVF